MSERFDTRQTLIERVRTLRSEEAWEEFSGIYREYVYIVVRQMELSHHDALDIVQDVMLVLWKKLPEIEIGEDAPKFRSWLCTVTRNAVRNFMRTAGRRSTRMEELERTEHDRYLQSIRLTELDTIAQREWEVYLANLAYERIKTRFTGKALEAFQSMLNGEPANLVANRLEIKVDSVYKLRMRVKQRMSAEIEVLKADLE